MSGQRHRSIIGQPEARLALVSDPFGTAAISTESADRRQRRSPGEVERLLEEMRELVCERDRLGAGGAGASEVAASSAKLDRLKWRLACAVGRELAGGPAG